MFNPFAGGKPPPQIEAVARLVEAAHALGVHQGATWGFLAGAVAGAVLVLLILRAKERQP